MAKKYKEIKIIKNPTDLHPTFVLDHVEAIKEHYNDNQRGDAKHDRTKSWSKKPDVNPLETAKLTSGINQSRRRPSRIILRYMNRTTASQSATSIGAQIWC
jgi:hypothetical protein